MLSLLLKGSVHSDPTHIAQDSWDPGVGSWEERATVTTPQAAHRVAEPGKPERESLGQEEVPGTASQGSSSLGCHSLLALAGPSAYLTVPTDCM